MEAYKKDEQITEKVDKSQEVNYSTTCIFEGGKWKKKKGNSQILSESIKYKVDKKERASIADFYIHKEFK